MGNMQPGGDALADFAHMCADAVDGETCVDSTSWQPAACANAYDAQQGSSPGQG